MSTRPKRPTKRERETAFKELLERLQAWDIPAEALDRVHEAAYTSLSEVKALTEYEDGKVSRLLTVVAFLSAVVGAVFTRFASDYAWPKFEAFHLRLEGLLPAATYAAFFIYIVVVTWAVLRVLGAIKPTFNIPATWKGTGHGALPSSMLFYAGILDVSAPRWGEAFEELTGADGQGLKEYYAKCYVAEAYLIAEKVADKLQVLSPGINAIRWAMGILLIYFVLFGATIIMIDPTKSAGPPLQRPQLQAPAPAAAR